VPTGSLTPSRSACFFSPKTHPWGAAGTRICALVSEAFPSAKYLIIYRIEEDEVVILRVIRGSRNIQALF
jgi:hypothetical protein